MWDLLLNDIYEIEEKQINMENSFYCGDAAGRK